MEQQNAQLFGLSLDATSRRFLSETAKWGRFLSIIGFIICALMIIAGIVFTLLISSSKNVFDDYNSSPIKFGALGPVIGFFYILLAILYFFPCLYLNRFSNKMTRAINSEDQVSMTAGFENLKSLFKFCGVVTIIIIACYVLAFVIGIVAATGR